MGLCCVLFPLGCPPPPHWMGLVLFFLQLETPRRDKFRKWNITHQVASAGKKE